MFPISPSPKKFGKQAQADSMGATIMSPKSKLCFPIVKRLMDGTKGPFTIRKAWQHRHHILPLVFIVVVNDNVQLIQIDKFYCWLEVLNQSYITRINFRQTFALRSCFKLKDDNSFTLVSTQTKIHKLILPLPGSLAC